MRDEAIKDAQKEFRAAIQEIAAVQRRLTLKRHKKFATAIYKRLGVKEPTGDFAGMTTVQCAKVLLKGGKAMTLKEMVVEIQARGCRPAETMFD